MPSKPNRDAQRLRATAETVRSASHTALHCVRAHAGDNVAASLLRAVEELTGGLQRVAQRLEQADLAGSIHPADAPPQEIFGDAAQPVVESPADLAAVLKWLAWMQTRETTVNARTDAAVAIAREFGAVDLHIHVDAERYTFAEWREKLEAAADSYLQDHADEVFEGKKRSVDFPAGRAALKTVAPTIALQPDVKAADVAGRIVERHKLQAALSKLLAKTGLTDRLKVSFALDLAGWQRLYKAEQVTGRDLPKGLHITDQVDKVTLKPVSNPGRAETAA